MKRRKRIVYVAAVGLLCLAALALRTVFHFDTVFAGEQVQFQEPDAWYHMRSVEHLLHNFPHWMRFDPYGAFPTGQPVATGPFFDYVIGTVALMVGGAEDRAVMETVGAWTPAVLGALMPAILYFLGRRLFGPLVGLLAAALIAFMPGVFLRVSSLGVTDHHIMESLLCALVMLCWMRAIQAARQENVSFERPYGRATALRSALAGVALGCYLATWVAGTLLVTVLALWALAECLHRHFRSRPAADVAIVTTPALAIAMLLYLPAAYGPWSNLALLALGGGALGVAALAAFADLLLRQKRAPFLLPAILAVLVVGAAAGFYAVFPETALETAGQVRFLSPSAQARTVAELQPLVGRSLSGSIRNLHAEFGISFFLACPAFLMLAVRTARKDRPDHLLFLVWSAVFLLIGFQQVRMGYYLAVNLALAAGLTGWLMLTAMRPRRRWAVALALAAVLVVTVLPPLKNSIRPRELATAWLDTLDWMRHETPEPFEDPAYFFHPYPDSPEEYTYPDSAYGVMNWWDEGYLVTYLGRRIPVSNGTQTGAGAAARFYLANNEDAAAAALEETGARYVLVDSRMQTLSLASEWGAVAMGKIHAMALWAGLDPLDYYETLTREVVEGVPETVVVYYPAYYRSLAIRLFQFEGQATIPEDSTYVIEVQPAEPAPGVRRKLISARRFATYGEAQHHIERNSARDLQIAGFDPGASCVPLDQLHGFTLLRSSRQTGPYDPKAQAVKVFSWTRPAPAADSSEE